MEINEQWIKLHRLIGLSESFKKAPQDGAYRFYITRMWSAKANPPKLHKLHSEGQPNYLKSTHTVKHLIEIVSMFNIKMTENDQ